MPNAEANVIRDKWLDFRIPGKGDIDSGKMTEEMTIDEMKTKTASNTEKIEMERKRQAVAAAWYISARGRPNLDQVGPDQ